ncbi:MAG TPA: FGGY family carbohydrate kinase [Thermomicrobiales bacterium]|nr:FGGY family carbohydrate kinase [Thermomicrobiales bacterium]
MTILALDLGTSAIKLVRTDHRLSIRSVDRIPAEGLHIDAWLNALRRNIADRGDGADINALAITGQMHGLMTLEDDGFGKGIPWTDQRGASIARSLNDSLGTETVARLGGPLASGFLGVSLAWIKANDPGRWSRIQHVTLPKDALVYALTGRHVTDPTDAVGTGLFDVDSGTWSEALVNRIGIPPDWLPEIVPSGTDLGLIAAKMATQLGLGRNTRVILAGGDAPVGAFGAGLARDGEALLLLSSGAQVILPSTRFSPDREGRWYTWPAVDGGYLRVGTLLNAGNAISWMSEVLDDTDSWDGGPTSLIALPHLIGERTPIQDADLRGVLLGLTHDTTSAQINMAMREGVAYAIRHALEVMCEGASPPMSIRIGGGGANIPGWQQVITDVLGIPTHRIVSPELTALGAAALAAGITPDPGLDRPCECDPDRTAPYAARYAIYREALDATRTISQRLVALDRIEHS